LKSSFELLKCSVRSFEYLDLIDLAEIAMVMKCQGITTNENEVHRKLIPRVIRKSSKDGDLSSVFYSVRSILVGLVMYNTSPQPTSEDVDTSIETSVTDVLLTPASDIDSREEEGTNDVQVSGDTSFEVCNF